jgi:hypothetical protein
MTDDNDKAEAFFILHDAGVVERKVADVLSKLFNDPIDRGASQRNATSFLYTLMIADAHERHPVMTRVMNELFDHGQMGSSFGRSVFFDSIRQLIRATVQEEIHRAMEHFERRVGDLKRAELNSRYNKFLR